MKSSFEDGTDNSKHRYDPSRIQNSSFRILWTIKTFESFEQLATDHVTDTDGDNDNEKGDKDLVTETSNNEMMK